MSIRRSATRSVLRDALKAGLPAALFSGLPSTVYAVLHNRDPLEATVAAGSILLPREQRRGRLVMAAIPVHLTLSVAWTVAIAIVLPRRNPLAEGTLAGLVIAALDLGVIGSRVPRIRALQTGPQIADHMAFGIIAAAELTRQEKSPHGT
jgi:hypothetical protein